MERKMEEIKYIIIEQNRADVFFRYGMYKEAIELLISMHPKRIKGEKNEKNAKKNLVN